MDIETPGSRLRALRKRTPKLTAEEVAASVGVSRGHLSMMENDKDLPGRETLDALASYYRVSVDYILHGGDAAPKPPNTREVVDDPDELALVRFWRGLPDAERRLMLTMLRNPPE